MNIKETHCKIKFRGVAVNYFRKKMFHQMFEKVLNTPLELKNSSSKSFANYKGKRWNSTSFSKMWRPKNMHFPMSHFKVLTETFSK